MTFTIDSYALNVLDFSEEAEPIGAEWIGWENAQLKRERFVYAIKRTWRLNCIEKNVAWSSSVINYLLQKMAANETVTFTVDEGDRYQLPATTVHIVNVEFNMPQVGAQNIRHFTVILKEA
ncbi:hypothetical protein J7L27_07760 [Candidatus Bathyarchaeota archaeon]|nr:hypothetical protein [Candidatus Bathyarchaeota archaeon]